MSRVDKEVPLQLQRWTEAVKTGDAHQVTRLYAADAILISTLKGDVKRGHSRIRDYFATDLLPKNPVVSVVALYARVMGEVAVNSGLYNFEFDTKQACTPSGRETVEARFTFVYRWSGMDWFIVEHHSSLKP